MNIPEITKVSPSPMYTQKVMASWYLSGDISIIYVKMQALLGTKRRPIKKM